MDTTTVNNGNTPLDMRRIAIFLAFAFGIAWLFALIIFMIQNTHTVQVTFLGLTGSTSLALMLLIAAVGGILLTLILGSARILQLRHSVRKRR